MNGSTCELCVYACLLSVPFNFAFRNFSLYNFNISPGDHMHVFIFPGLKNSNEWMNMKISPSFL